jgi:chitinase
MDNRDFKYLGKWGVIITAALLMGIGLSVGKCRRTVPSFTAAKSPPKIVMGYYPAWEREAFDHTQVEYRYLTHLAHAFTKPDAEGNLIVHEKYIYPELIRAAHENNVKVIMSIGGWGNCEGFPPMAAESEHRQKFIGQILEFCGEHGYDGVDIDWEFVSNPKEQQDFVLFIKELSSVLKAQDPPLFLSMAAPSGHLWGRWINYEQLIEDFDCISIMTYNYHGEWSIHSGHNAPLFTCQNDPCGSFHDSYLYARSREIPLHKLLLGIPFYGRSFDASGLYLPFKTSSSYSYKKVVDFLDSGWTYFWDECSSVPYLMNPENTEFISFDDARSISLKCEYIKLKGVAGLIIWDLSLDRVKDSSVLLRTIGEKFENK